jgi:hypothetical protein
MIGVKMFKNASWAEISQHFFHREISDLQCNERYTNILSEAVNSDKWSADEDEHLLRLIDLHGPKWALISRAFHGSRTDNQCKRRAHIISNRLQKKKKNEVRGRKRREAKFQAKQASKKRTASIFKIKRILRKPRVKAERKVRPKVKKVRVKKEAIIKVKKEKIVKVKEEKVVN